MSPRLAPLVGLAPPPVDKRPRCLSCRERLTPNVTPGGDVDRRCRTWEGTYGDTHGFCGEGCAARFGRLMRRMLRQLPLACYACGAAIVNPYPELRR